MSKTKEEYGVQYYADLWSARNASMPALHTKQRWDQRADDWVNNFGRPKGHQRRLEAIASFLRRRGLLEEDMDVMDIGCGPGLYVAEFAKTARSACGTDISSRMLEHAAAHAAQQGLTNVDFTVCDFAQADVRVLGWEGAFDLVFSSITPALRGLEALDKVHAMSRKWCFHNGWARRHNALQERIAAAVFPHVTQDDVRGGMGEASHCLYNILWLKGHYPEVRYYAEVTEQWTQPSEETAQHFASRILPPQEGCSPDAVREQDVEKVYDWLRKNAQDGRVFERIESLYMWLLWQSQPGLRPEWEK